MNKTIDSKEIIMDLEVMLHYTDEKVKKSLSNYTFYEVEAVFSPEIEDEPDKVWCHEELWEILSQVYYKFQKHICVNRTYNIGDVGYCTDAGYLFKVVKKVK